MGVKRDGESFNASFSIYVLENSGVDRFPAENRKSLIVYRCKCAKAPIPAIVRKRRWYAVRKSPETALYRVFNGLISAEHNLETLSPES
jgi:hypothetical protein